MLDILNLALPFFALIALGLVASKLWQGSDGDLRWLNIFVLYFALPALIFSIVAATPLEQLSDWRFVVAAILATSLTYFAMYVVSMHGLAMPKRTAALAATATSYGNVGYMGLPLAVAFFGAAAGVPAAIVFCIDCTLLFLLTAIFGAQTTTGQGRGQQLVSIGKDVITHPFIVSTVFGILASGFGFKPWGAVSTVLDMLARAAGPAALFAMGLTVGLRPFKGLKSDVFVLTSIKLLLQPLLMFGLMLLIANPDSLWLKVAVMMAALPTASNAFILARQYNSYVEGASTAVLVTTVLSALTIPAIVYWLG
jgi:malonate transporter and related proteins